MRTWPRSSGRCGRVAAILASTALISAACLKPPLPEPQATPTPAPAVIDRLREQARSSVFRVRNRTCVSVGVGSGFALESNVLVTNAHVAGGAEEIEVNTWDGRVERTTVGSLAGLSDLAVVRLNTALPGVSPVADADPPPGTPVYAVGFPGGQELSITEGTVIDYVSGRRFGELGNVMRITARIERGNSGGPLWDQSGRVVGVVYAIERATEYGLVIPVSKLRAVLSDVTFEPIQGICD